MKLDRRRFIQSATGAAICGSSRLAMAHEAGWQPRYMLASCMYGTLPLNVILPEVRKVGASSIDIWPRVHGNQREQLDEMGEAKFQALLNRHKVTLGCITQYKLGPFGLRKEMKLAQRLRCETIVTGGRGPRGLKGAELKSAVRAFVEQLKPHLELAGECGVTVAIENHGNNLIESPDSMKWLAELAPAQAAIAFAPYHLPQDEKLLSRLIQDLEGRIAVFYAWQHGMGCSQKLPMEQELLQMPGRGSLDFQPLLESLSATKFRGWTEIFMHPVPRGIPILETAPEVTREINAARAYLSRVST